jgi:hypothetical protein
VVSHLRVRLPRARAADARPAGSRRRVCQARLGRPRGGPSGLPPGRT